MKKKDKIKAFLGENTSFEGKLSFEDTIQIDGYFKGDITASGHLVIGRKGVIESNINVQTAIVSGEVHGNIKAEQFIEFRVPGKMFGDIESPTVVIEKGVIFEGHCRTNPFKAEEDIKKLTESDKNSKEKNSKNGRKNT